MWPSNRRKLPTKRLKHQFLEENYYLLQENAFAWLSAPGLSQGGWVGVGQTDGWLQSTCQLSPPGSAHTPSVSAFALLGWGRSPLCPMHYLQSGTAQLSEATRSVQTRAGLSPWEGDCNHRHHSICPGESGSVCPRGGCGCDCNSLLCLPPAARSVCAEMISSSSHGHLAR